VPDQPATAEFCRAHPEVDLGVHATLNAEWESSRWGPVSTSDPASGLLDQDGYVHQWHAGVYAHAKREAVETEINAQVEKALAAGINISHIDSHMGTAPAAQILRLTAPSVVGGVLLALESCFWNAAYTRRARLLESTQKLMEIKSEPA
jgi:predicted glycoside hydrolase/deacetylase ChbG (UPF0249 family)